MYIWTLSSGVASHQFLHQRPSSIVAKILLLLCLSSQFCLGQTVRLVFPHIGVGDIFTTVADLTNKGAAEFDGFLAVVDDQGFFLPVFINGVPVSDFYDFNIPTGSVRRFELTRTGPDVGGHIIIWDFKAPAEVARAEIAAAKAQLRRQRELADLQAEVARAEMAARARNAAAQRQLKPSTSTFAPLTGRALFLFGGEDQEAYLGCLNCSELDPDSILNPLGKYGSSLSPDSIRNPLGRYGSSLSNYSVTNPLAQDPPVAFDIDGTFVGRLTANELLRQLPPPVRKLPARPQF